MNYLFGDSTESNVDFNYLAFVPEVIDSAVVLVEAELALVTTVERRRILDKETLAAIGAVDDLGKRAAELVVPIAKDQAATPVGRCAASIAAAIREAVERESTLARTKLAGEREEISKVDQKVYGRAKDVLEKLLRTHDLPNAQKELDVTWTNTAVKATMRQKASFGVEAVLALEIPATSLFVPDLRVDRITEGVEVRAVEAGGWLKKSDKLVPHKLGRYQVARIIIGTDVMVRLRSGPDANATGFDVRVRKGELTIEPTGNGADKELTIDDRDRPKLQMLVERLEAAARLLETRVGLVSVEIDGKPIAEHGHPRVLAERLIVAIAPTVQKIARHSRSPGELVLRRPLGGNRREELFVSTAELVQRFDKLPANARDLFAPLQLEGESWSPPEPTSAPVEVKAAPTPQPEVVSQPVRSSPAIPVPAPDVRSGANRTAPPPMPEGRRTSRTSPPPISTAPPLSSSARVQLPQHGATKPEAGPDEAKPAIASVRPPAVIIDMPPEANDDGAAK
jgi:hypothetical protein